MKEKIQLDIPVGTLLKVALVYFGILFLWQIRSILVLFFVVLVLVAAISPVVDRWSRKMNRVVAITLIYIILVGVVGAVGILVLPPLVSQLQQLSHKLPGYLNTLSPSLGDYRSVIDASQEGLSSIASNLADFGFRIYNVTLGFFGGIAAVFTVVVLTFYLLVEEHGAKKFILDYLPVDNREKVASVLQKIGIKMGAWLRGQLILALIVGAVDGVGMALLGVDFALILGVWAGFTELIPYIGPVLGAIPGVILAFLVSPLIGIIALAFYILVQQFEASYLVPRIMQKAVGLSPVIIILAIIIGANLAGLVGVVLSIPVAAAIGVVVKDWKIIKDAARR